MDQIILVISGTIITAYYILSPVKLSEKLFGLIEGLGSGNIGKNVDKAQRVIRSYYYVRGIK